MDFWTFLLWMVIIGIAFSLGQVILTIIIYVVVIALAIISLPFTWVYGKIKGE